jgi:hypothetical protein
MHDGSAMRRLVRKDLRVTVERLVHGICWSAAHDGMHFLLEGEQRILEIVMRRDGLAAIGRCEPCSITASTAWIIFMAQRSRILHCALRTAVARGGDVVTLTAADFEGC